MTRVVLVGTIVLLLCDRAAAATLIDFGNGMVYDTVQDLTWLQDARHSQTSGVDDDGKMPFAQAVAWAAGLEYGGFDDWRLPRWFGWSASGSFNDSSELARLFAEIGWVADRYGYMSNDLGAGPFQNVLTPGVDLFWLDMTHNNTWHESLVFYFPDGGDGESQGAWAVRDGPPSTNVPEPSTLLLVGVGLLALARRGRASKI